MSKAMAVVMNVELTNGQIPNSDICGCHFVPVKNFQRSTSGEMKNNSASLPSSYTIPTVVTMENAPQKNSIPVMSVSLTRVRLRKSTLDSISSIFNGNG